MSLRILVTGGTGFLGSHLTKSLVMQGHQITLLKRSSSKTSYINEILPKCKFYDVDITQLDRIFSESKTFDMIVHLSTCYGRQGEDLNTIQEANCNYPLKLLELATVFGVKFFINTDTALPPKLNAYSLSKAQLVEWGRYLAVQNKINFINLKLEHFFGPGDGEYKFITHVIRSCLNNISELRLTEGEQKRDFIYIEDVVYAYQLILNSISSFTGSFNEFMVGSSQAISIRSLVEKIHIISKSKTHLKFGAIPYRPNEIMFSEANIDSLIQLGWSPRFSLEQALTMTISQEKKLI